MLNLPTFIEPTAEQIVEFWTQHPDLLDCIFPTRRYSESNIGPAYPGMPGRFNPDTQKLTLAGLEQLATIAAGDSPKGRAIDGLRAKDEEQDQYIGGIVGMCVKPVDNKLIIIDFDLPVARLGELPGSDELNAVLNILIPRSLATRGNRERLTLTLRQGDDLFPSLLKRLETVKKMTLTLKSQTDWKIEISVSNGSQGNIAGLHKSGTKYLVAFPSEKLAAMSIGAFDKFLGAVQRCGFNIEQATVPGLGDGRVSIDDDAVVNNSTLQNVNFLIKVIAHHRPEYTIPVGELIPRNTLGLMRGDLTYNHGDKWQTKYTRLHQPGNRRDTLWQIVSDLAALRAFLYVLQVPFDDGFFDALMERVATTFQPDSRSLQVKVRGEYKTVYKWSSDYVYSVWERERDNERYHGFTEAYAQHIFMQVQAVMGQEVTRLRDEYQAQKSAA